MNETPNPYQPPADIPQNDSRWTRLLGQIRGFPWTQKSYFRRGGMFIVEGVAFYIDPSDMTIMFAASPSATTNNERMNLVVSETIRVLPIFLADYPSLQGIMRGRRLVVRMIETYDKQDAVVREQTLEWDVLNAFLDAQRKSDET